jgi:hypothetical protein
VGKLLVLLWGKLVLLALAVVTGERANARPAGLIASIEGKGEREREIDEVWARKGKMSCQLT